MNLIKRNKSIIIACDFSDINKLINLVNQTAGSEIIGGYKIGSELSLSYGLPRVIKEIKKITKKTLIYDHQKAGTDIPEMGEKFARTVKKAGADAVILFPFAGIETEGRWIQSCQQEKVAVLVGGHMTHKGFLEGEGGFISEKSIEKIYLLAVKLGVADFIVPGNKLKYVIKYKQLIERKIGKKRFTIYSPGFISQGGKIKEYKELAGIYWHPIIGRAIYQSRDIRKKIKEIGEEISYEK